MGKAYANEYEYDVFISYARVNNKRQSVGGKNVRWVDEFRKQLFFQSSQFRKPPPSAWCRWKHVRLPEFFVEFAPPLRLPQWGGVPRGGDEGDVNYAQFRADGSRVVTASDDNTARIWKTPGPAWDDPAWLKASVDFRTRLTWDEKSRRLRRLSFAELTALRQLLDDEYEGELCDSPSWEDIDRWIDEKRRLAEDES